MSTKRRTAAECIAFHLGWDMRDVSDNRYQAGRQKHAVYSIGDSYYCCPPAGQNPPGNKFPDSWNWVKVGESYGRPVYCSEASA